MFVIPNNATKIEIDKNSVSYIGHKAWGGKMGEKTGRLFYDKKENNFYYKLRNEKAFTKVTNFYKIKSA